MGAKTEGRSIQRKEKLREILLQNPMSTIDEIFDLNRCTLIGHGRSDGYKTKKSVLNDVNWLYALGGLAVDADDRWQVTPVGVNLDLSTAPQRRIKSPWKDEHKEPGDGDRARFEAKYRIDENGCFIWIGAFGGNRGTFNLGKIINAHKASWILYRGEIPPGMLVLHKCNVANCVNPAHLYLGSSSDNTRDMLLAGRGRRSRHGLPHGVAKMRGKFQARFGTKSYGTFATMEEAEIVAASVRVKYFIGGDVNS